jgi:hypothetical protein
MKNGPGFAKELPGYVRNYAEVNAEASRFNSSLVARISWIEKGQTCLIKYMDLLVALW